MKAYANVTAESNVPGDRVPNNVIGCESVSLSQRVDINSYFGAVRINDSYILPEIGKYVLRFYDMKQVNLN